MGSKAMQATEGTGRRWPPSLLADLELGVPDWRRESSGKQAGGEIAEQDLSWP